MYSFWTIVLASLLKPVISSHAPLLHQHKKPLDIVSIAQETPNKSSPLEIFQVYKPVPEPVSTGCFVEQTLMTHTFASSYGVPFVGDYTPPTCEFNTVIIQWSVTVAGRQFDRLAEMYLGDVEIWRTSTAEPIASGIHFGYEKDVSMYLALWKQPQTLIFSLNNVYDQTYTGAFNTTLTATFLWDGDGAAHADVILPISKELGGSGEPSIFTLPSDDATVQQTLPPNVKHAMVSIGATGQSNEEFWYNNVLQSDIDTFDSGIGTLLGYGPFREVQLLIDGMLAGVAWPFPIIFTGGIAPGFWKPIVGIDAYDLREYEIDITPFLPYLLDGKAHSFTIKVVGVDDNGGNGDATLSEESINSYWLVSGKILLFLDDQGNYTAVDNITHVPPTISTIPLVHTTSDITTSPNGTNLTYAYEVTAQRTYASKSAFGSWVQSLSYYNNGYLSSSGLFQSNNQSTTGLHTSTSLSAQEFSFHQSFSYPIYVATNYTMSGSNLTISAILDRGLEIESSGRPDISTYTLVSGAMRLDTRQVGDAKYSNAPGNNYSFGNMDQEFFEKSYGRGYERHVVARNLSVLEDSTS